jgi:uncharacterized protein (DUF2147 family)
MSKFALSGLFLIATAVIANAAEPTGEWRVEDGTATIRVVDCNSRIWGVVAWEKDPGNLDTENPDRTKKNRPTLGIPILLNMKRVADEKDKWAGGIYNAKDGKIYDASIQLKSQNALAVEGCLAFILCGGQTWTRVENPAGAMGSKSAASGNPASKATAPTAAPKAGGPKSGTADPAATEICLLPEIAGAPH